MAKVTMPLGSFTAQNSIGKAHVHFQWHGIAVVRKWFKPAQMNSPTQGDFRQIFGGLGAATKPVQKTSLYAVDAKAVAVSPNTYVSEFVQYMAKAYMVDATAFEAEVTAYEGATGKSAFDAAAVTLGLNTLTVAYKGTDSDFAGGLQVYELAKYAIERHGSDATKFNRAPYTTALASWTGTQTALLIADLLPVA